MAGERINNIWDMIFDRQNDYQPTMQQEVDYANYMANQTNAQSTQAPVMATQPVSDRQVVDLGRPPIVNNDIPNTVANTPGSMDAMDMMGMFPQNMATGAVDQAWESQRPKELVKEPSFMDKASDFFGDEERMARMTIALNSMRLNPDPNIAKSMELKLDRLQKNKQSNKSVQWLRDNATPTNQYDKYADLIEKNPEMASELMKQVMGIGKGGYKTSAVQVDPETGQKYVVKTNPADGSVIREDVEGAIGTTYQQEQDIASKARLKEQDTKDAYKASQDVFMEAQDMRGNVRELYKMIPLLDKGAETGLLRQYLPSFEANTAQLRTIGNKLGINVINMATFGALSEKELNLALKTAIDLSLPPAELRKQILMKIEAQEKLMNELYGEAQKLSSGTVGYQEYINENSKKFLRSQETRYNALNAEEKKAVSNDAWMGMNLQQREAFIKARSK